VCSTECAYSPTDISDSGDGAVTVFRVLYLFNYIIPLHLISRGLFEAGAVTRTLIDYSVCSFRLSLSLLYMNSIYWKRSFFFVLQVAMVTVTYSGISCPLFRVPGDAYHVIKF
jgi:hypothetical protein